MAQLASTRISSMRGLPLLRPAPNAYRPLLLSIRHASSKAPVTDKSRILEKPTKFNPPSHGSRRTRPRMYPGPQLSEHERQEQSTKRYPNMMPPEGSFLHWFLNSRALHLWITLSILSAACIYSLMLSFLSATSLRHLLPSGDEWLWHPIRSMRQFVAVYKQHVELESEKVAEKRRQKLADVEKRKEFMRAHGVEPGFLTGGWMDKFGTIESDKAREAVRLQQEAAADQGIDVQSPVASEAGAVQGAGNAQPEQSQPRRKPKYFFGIW